MATQFNGYKKKLDNLFVKEKKRLQIFYGPYEKIKDQWEEFVKYKTSRGQIKGQPPIRKMMLIRYATIPWGKEATRLAGLSGKNGRTN
jgi:hypothetical protein